MIVVVNLDLGNMGSIMNMLRKIGAAACLSSRLQDIEAADKLILPGVGAFDNAMSNLKELKIMPVLDRKVLGDRTPILGICLGAQLMTKESEEGRLPGLGWINGCTARFDFGSNPRRLKVPHMGWNEIIPGKESKLLCSLANEGEEQRFYFVHSYHLVCDNPRDVLATAHYGYEFVAAFARDNIYGVQFHPEKSHKFGMRLMENFAKL